MASVPYDSIYSDSANEASMDALAVVQAKARLAKAEKSLEAMNVASKIQEAEEGLDRHPP